MLEELAGRQLSSPVTLAERVASMDEQHTRAIDAMLSRLDTYHKRLLQNDLVLSRHDSEIESLLRHDHTHEDTEAPRSLASTVTQ